MHSESDYDCSLVRWIFFFFSFFLSSSSSFFLPVFRLHIGLHEEMFNVQPVYTILEDASSGLHEKVFNAEPV